MIIGVSFNRLFAEKELLKTSIQNIVVDRIQKHLEFLKFTSDSKWTK